MPVVNGVDWVDYWDGMKNKVNKWIPFSISFSSASVRSGIITVLAAITDRICWCNAENICKKVVRRLHVASDEERRNINFWKLMKSSRAWERGSREVLLTSHWMIGTQVNLIGWYCAMSASLIDGYDKFTSHVGDSWVRAGVHLTYMCVYRCERYPPWMYQGDFRILLYTPLGKPRKSDCDFLDRDLSRDVIGKIF